MAKKQGVGIILKDQLLEAVTEYKYLGQIISIDDRKNKKLGAHIANAWKKILV